MNTSADVVFKVLAANFILSKVQDGTVNKYNYNNMSIVSKLITEFMLEIQNKGIDIVRPRANKVINELLEAIFESNVDITVFANKPIDKLLEQLKANQERLKARPSLNEEGIKEQVINKIKLSNLSDEDCYTELFIETTFKELNDKFKLLNKLNKLSYYDETIVKRTIESAINEVFGCKLKYDLKLELDKMKNANITIKPLSINTEFEDGQTVKPYIKENGGGDWCYETIETFINNDNDSNDSSDNSSDSTSSNNKSGSKTCVSCSSFINSMNSLNIINLNNYKDEQLQTKLYSIYQLLTNASTNKNDEFVKAIYEFYSELEKEQQEHKHNTYELPKRNEKAYFQALIEKYPILKTKKRWDFRVDDNITLFSGDNWGMSPVVKVDVFGLGEAEVVSSGSDHYQCEFEDSESPLAEINKVANNYHIDIDQTKLLENMIDSIREYVDGWEDLINSIRSASTIDELCLAVEKLEKAVKDTEKDIYQIDEFGGLIWSNIEEAKHVIELMSIYYRLGFVESDTDTDNDYYLVLRPESDDDWKAFADSEDKKWFDSSVDKRKRARSAQNIEYNELGFSFSGINLINLETILKYHELTNSSIIPKLLLINLHNEE